ncbi:MAG: CBS domain-containing protein [Candidatus Thermoplasmatota archaeon]
MSKGKTMVKEAMNTKPITVKPGLTIKKAAEIMKENNIGNCIVLEKKPIGIITESDISKKIVAEDKKPSEINIEKIMSKPLIVTNPYIDIEEAIKIMCKSKIRRLPVVEKEELVGIITEKDIFRLSPMLLELAREWSKVTKKEGGMLEEQVYAGKCEDCGMLSTNLKDVDGLLLCEDCRH